MGITEALKALQNGKWIRRKIWHPEYAIRLCNVDYENGKAVWRDDIPIYGMSTLGYLYHFMSTSVPHVNEDLHESNRKYEGMQHDIMCNDWEIADTEFCLKIAARSEIEHQEFLKKAHEESCRLWGSGVGRDYGIIEFDDGRWC